MAGERLSEVVRDTAADVYVAAAGEGLEDAQPAAPGCPFVVLIVRSHVPSCDDRPVWVGVVGVER